MEPVRRSPHAQLRHRIKALSKQLLLAFPKYVHLKARARLIGNTWLLLLSACLVVAVLRAKDQNNRGCFDTVLSPRHKHSIDHLFPTSLL